MTKLEDIERAIRELPADQLAKFRTWFEDFDGSHFDQRIAKDAKTGRLDRLSEQALEDFRQGHARKL